MGVGPKSNSSRDWVCWQLPGTAVGMIRFVLVPRVTYVHERPQKLDKKKKKKKLLEPLCVPATYLPPPEVLAHSKGNCDILGAGFLLPTVISVELSDPRLAAQLAHGWGVTGTKARVMASATCSSWILV